MSIPRLAIHRPVTMFMISAVVTVLGLISLTRLPVDLMPDVSFPSITVRVSYQGVGPLEMEELVTRPIEQAVSAVAGLERLDSTSSEGISRVTLNFGWGTDLAEATDDVRSRIDRIRGRLPEEADPPTIFKFDSTSQPIMGVGVEGDFSPVELRELAQNDLAQRLERVPGVAAVTVDGGLRRQIHVELSKEKITALNLSVDRVVNLLRNENQNIPLGEVDEGDSTYLLRSQGQFSSLEDISNLVVLTKDGVPVYMRDIAEVKDSTEDRRQFMRINGRPGVRMRVQKQSGENTVAIAHGVKDEMERINREVPGVRLQVLDDSSIFIERAIHNVQEHALVGSVLVILIIFAFLRDWRSTLIVSTSIPISVIGTFALLYFAGFTLNTMTFGGLALGIGMIVDAAIVVLENTYRHLEMGKDRMTAAIDGAEEVWSAILASTLTHIAVFIPLLFLTGVSSVLFTQLSIVVMFSLAMSLFVAVTIVPVLCSRWLSLPHESAKQGVMARFYTASERFLEGMDNRYRRIIHLALAHRPTVIGVSVALVVIAAMLLPMVGFELVPQADEGEVRVEVELPVGTRIERTEAMILRLENDVRRAVPEATMIITNAGGGGMGGFGGGGSHRGDFQIRLKPRDERTRTNDEIAQALRRQLAGLPGVIIRARPSGGNFQMNRMLGGGDSRLALEIRGHDLDDSRRLSQEARGRTSGNLDPRRSAEGGAVRAERHQRGRDDPDERRRNAGRVLSRARQRVPDRRAAAPGGPRAHSRRRGRAGEHPLRAGGAGEEPDGRRPRSRPGADRAEEPGAHHAGERRNRGHAERRGERGRRPPRPAARAARLLRRVRLGGRRADARVPPAAGDADPRDRPRLRRDGVAVRVAARSVHHHVLGAGGGDRRRAHAAADGHRLQPAGLHRRHHARRYRRLERDPAGGLHQHAAPSGRHAAA
jgi:HAE1 family hydrophobic/amphiphilic exporter-1